MKRGAVKLRWAGDTVACSGLFYVINYPKKTGARSARAHSAAKPSNYLACLYSEAEEDPFYEVKITHHQFLCLLIFNSFEKTNGVKWG